MLACVYLVLMHRRIEWFFRYRTIIRCDRWRRELQYWIGCSFLDACPSFEKIQSFVAPKPGIAHDICSTIAWEAPFVVAIYLEHGLAVAIAVEFCQDALCIKQLQGVHGYQIPPELKHWPRLFVQACLYFAKEEGIRFVRLYRADQSLMYHFPSFIQDQQTVTSRDELGRALRSRMRRRYDGTARQMKAVMKEEYGEWDLSDYERV